MELFSIPERFQENFRKFLTSDEIGDNGEKEDDPQPSVSDMELEAEARRQFFKEQMEAEEAFI